MKAAVTIEFELDEAVVMEILSEAMKKALSTGSISEDEIKEIIAKHGNSILKAKGLGNTQAP